MADDILEMKKTLDRIASDTKRIRLEKYRDIKCHIERMDKETKTILYNEYRRDYDSHKRTKDVYILITTFMSIVSLMISLTCAFWGNRVMSYELYQILLLMVVVIFVGIVYIILFVELISSRGQNQTRYILDIFEEMNE